jgi:hypothetical protein
MSEAEQHRLDEVAGVQMPDDRVMTVKPGRRRVLRLSILASGAVLVLAIGSYGIAAAVTTSAPAVTSTPTVPVHNGDGPGARGFGGPRPGGFGGAGGFGAGAGSTAPAGSQIVTAIQSGSLTVAGAEGSARTVVTTTSTRYTVDGTAASASALAVGDKVTIEPVHPSDTGESNSTTAPGATATAADVNVILPELSGDVTALTSNAITLTDAQGFWRTI